jgi:hypothetical protein
MKATPQDWEIAGLYDHGPDLVHANQRHVIMSEYGEVCRVPHYMHAAGATDKIIKAVNSHAALVAALEDALDVIRLMGCDMSNFKQARAALAKAQGEGGAE